MFICILPLDTFLEGSSYDRSFYITKSGKLVYIIISYRQCCDREEKLFALRKLASLVCERLEFIIHLYTRDICVALLTQKSLNFTNERVECKIYELRKKRLVVELKLDLSREEWNVCAIVSGILQILKVEVLWVRVGHKHFGKLYFMLQQFMDLSLRCLRAFVQLSELITNKSEWMTSWTSVDILFWFIQSSPLKILNSVFA